MKACMNFPRIWTSGKHWLIMTLIILPGLYSPLEAQINQYDENGNKHGPWRENDSQGHIRYEGTFEHGVPVDTFKRYYRYRKIQSIAVYSQSGRVVNVQMFHENGNLKAEGKYVDREKDSTWKYYNSRQALVKKEHYNQGVPHGTWVIYYSINGEVSETFEYKDGVKHGPWIQYFPQGNVKLRANYEQGKLEGPFVVYYADGSVMRKGQYENNYRSGIWITKDREGEVIRKIRHNKGYETVIFDNTPEQERQEEPVRERPSRGF